MIAALRTLLDFSKSVFCVLGDFGMFKGSRAGGGPERAESVIISEMSKTINHNNFSSSMLCLSYFSQNES